MRRHIHITERQRRDYLCMVACNGLKQPERSEPDRNTSVDNNLYRDRYIFRLLQYGSSNGNRNTITGDHGIRRNRHLQRRQYSAERKRRHKLCMVAGYRPEQCQHFKPCGIAGSNNNVYR